MSASTAHQHIPNTLPLAGGIPDTHRPHTESTTTILVPKENTAFLNPVQQYNRDLSISVIRAWNELRKEEAEARWRKRQERAAEGAKKRKDKQAAGKAGEEGVEGAIVEEGLTEAKYKPSKFTILEALSATGLRSIRYAKEIPDVKYVLANDLSESACEAMRMNVALNGVGEPIRKNGESSKSVVAPAGEGQGATEKATAVDAEEAAANGELTEQEQMDRIGRRDNCTGIVKINEGDACALMYARRSPAARVDVVDLDPYGTAAPFIDSAIGCIADGGLLCVTCTDLAVLAGSSYPEKAFSNYGGTPIHAEYAHEAALRLVLSSLATAAARYGRYITPLLSFSIDFYVRLFVRVDTQAQNVKDLSSQMGTVYACSYCQSYTPQPFGRVVPRQDKKGNSFNTYKTAPAVKLNNSECEHCGGTLHLGGPMWLAPIHDSAFAGRVLKEIEGDQDKYGTWTRMHGMLTLAQEELQDPFFFTNNKLHGFFRSTTGRTLAIVSALLNAGYKVSRSHAASGSIKTNAPRSFIFDIVRECIKTQPVRLDKISESSPARKLIGAPMTHTIDFTTHPDAKKYEKGEKGEKVMFYQLNPTSHWGPGSRAKTVKSGQTGQASAGGPRDKRKAEDELVQDTQSVAEQSEQGGGGAKRSKVDQDGGAEGVAEVEQGDEEAAVNA